MIITFKLGKKGKINIGCTDSKLFESIREHFSVKNTAAVYLKRYNPHIPSRKYMITAGGQCEMGMYWEIERFLLEKQVVVKVELDLQLKTQLNCGWKPEDYTFSNDLKLTLRGYQEETVKLALQSGRGMCILGTGAGKTLVTASLIENYFRNTKSNEHFKCLVIVPDLSLVNQTYKEFVDVGVSFSLTRWTGSYKPDLNSNVIICNISILQNQIEANEWVKWVDLLIVDEAHKSAALETGKIINSINTPHKFGFTGTLPDKNEAKWSVLGKLGPVLYTKNSAELRDQKFLADVAVKVLNIKYKARYIDDYRKELEFIYNSEFRNSVINQICSKFDNNILVLVNHIAHGEVLFEKMKNLEHKQVFFIQGSVEVDRRDEIKQIMELHNNVICIAMSSIFSTGVNIKNLHLICFAAGGKAFIRTVQSIGRGLRLHENKNKLILVDIQDDLKYGNNHGDLRKQIYDREKIRYSEKDIVEG